MGTVAVMAKYQSAVFHQKLSSVGQCPCSYELSDNVHSQVILSLFAYFVPVEWTATAFKLSYEVDACAMQNSELSTDGNSCVENGYFVLYHIKALVAEGIITV